MTHYVWFEMPDGVFGPKTLVVRGDIDEWILINDPLNTIQFNFFSKDKRTPVFYTKDLSDLKFMRFKFDCLKMARRFAITFV
jgi:hypothetical protein